MLLVVAERKAATKAHSSESCSVKRTTKEGTYDLASDPSISQCEDTKDLGPRKVCHTNAWNMARQSYSIGQMPPSARKLSDLILISSFRKGNFCLYYVQLSSMCVCLASHIFLHFATVHHLWLHGVISLCSSPFVRACVCTRLPAKNKSNTSNRPPYDHHF